MTMAHPIKTLSEFRSFLAGYMWGKRERDGIDISAIVDGLFALDATDWEAIASWLPEKFDEADIPTKIWKRCEVITKTGNRCLNTAGLHWRCGIHDSPHFDGRRIANGQGDRTNGSTSSASA